MTYRGNGLRSELRGFVAEHRDGWSHGHWETLLQRLRQGGYDTEEPDAIGVELERERILVVLEDAGIRGLGPKRREVLADRFGSLWRLKHASVDELIEQSLPRNLAEKVHAALA